jgi:uncharacterized RDD family membrane protein YckC
MNEIRTDAIGSRYAGGPPPLDVYLQRFGSEPRVLYAGFRRRFAAASVDGILTGIANILLINVLEGLVLGNQLEAGETMSGTAFIAWFAGIIVFPALVGWLYTAGMESSSRQATLGKRLFGISVTDLRGNRISFGRASGRFFARYLSGALFMLGYLVQPFTAKRQTLHDAITGTLVVRNWPRVPADYRPGMR